MFILVVVQGVHQGQRYPLEKENTVIGRDRSCDIPLDDEGISRNHIKFILRNESVLLEDLQSTNGTYLNSKRIVGSNALAHGDRIALGNTVILVQSDRQSSQQRAVVADRPHKSGSLVRLDMATSSVVDILGHDELASVTSEAHGQKAFLALHEFITRISGILDTGVLLGKAIESIVTMAHADRGSILLLNNKSEIIPEATFNKEEKTEVVVSRTIVEEVLNTTKGILSAEAAKDKRFKHTTALSLAEISSMICVPLLIKDKPLGVVYVDTTYKSRQLTEDDLRLLTAMALELSVNIESTNLYAMLKDSEEFGACVIKSIPGGILVVDTQGRIVRANRNGVEMVNLSLNDVLGFSLAEIPAFVEISVLVGATLKSGKPQESQELHVFGQDSEQIRVPVNVNTALLEDYVGRPIGVVVHFHDLTRVHQLAEQVKRAERLSALGKMASGIAHEIRNPLNSVQGFVQLLQESVATGQEKEYCSIVLDEVNRINGIVQDMLDFSRVQKFSTKLLDLDALARKVHEQLLAQAEKEGIDFAFQAATMKLPLVSGNQDKLKQVLLNILRNAMDATPQEGLVVLGVEYDADATVPMLKLVIRDTGTGICEEDLSCIFDPFYTTKDRGTGLGLSICQNIIEQHAGKILVESKPGQGTTFSILLPASTLSSK